MKPTIANLQPSEMNGSMTVLFPAFCDGLREPDPEFQREAEALESLGIPWRVVNIAAVASENLEKAFRFFQGRPGERILYRGWILLPHEYDALNMAVAGRGSQLITDPVSYRSALLFPEFYPQIRSHSFPATWILGSDPAEAWKAAAQLGPPPYFIKDFAKSAKEIWPSGCVVSGEDGEAGMAREIAALKEYRGALFTGGIVIRPLVSLRYLAEHPFGGKIYEEYRMFFFKGRQIVLSAYDRIGGDGRGLPDYRFLADRIRSPLFSADIAVTEEGKAFVLEIGDGGASSLPPRADRSAFFDAIRSLD